MPVTDRLNDKNLIELAKQQYENKKRSTIPSELVTLPSKGKVYPKSNPLSNGTVEMRYMTAYDEDILTNLSYIRAGTYFDKLLANLIMSPVNVDDIIPADKDALIIAARIHGYGAEYNVTVTDPVSKATLSRVMDLSKIKMREFALENNDAGEFEYKAEGIDIKFKFLAKKQIDAISPERVNSDFLKQSIVECNGMRDTLEIENFIMYQMTPKESREFRTYVTDNIPGIVLEAEFEGETGGTFNAGFQIGSDLFWL
jgi:hypothetical protein